MVQCRNFWNALSKWSDTHCMGTTTLISVDEYLGTVYRPDCDFIDGVVRERSLGEQQHAQLQMILGAIFYNNRERWSVRAVVEQRVQTSATHYRVADVCILRASDPVDGIVRVPPLVCIEILSRGDTLAELQSRVDDYQAMGVDHIWALDPWQRKGYVASKEGFLQPPTGTFAIPGTPISITLSDILAEFDHALRRR